MEKIGNAAVGTEDGATTSYAAKRLAVRFGIKTAALTLKCTMVSSSVELRHSEKNCAPASSRRQHMEGAELAIES